MRVQRTNFERELGLRGEPTSPDAGVRAKFGRIVIAVGLVIALGSGWLAPTFAHAQSSADAIPKVIFKVERFEVRGLNPLSPEETQKVLSDFTGAHEGLEGLLAAADALESRFRHIGFTFHRVNLPAQTLTGGTVVLEVTEIAIGSVEVRGNEHSDAATVLRSVPSLAVGRAPDTRALSKALLLTNEHGSRRTDVQERDPESFFVTFANSGSPSTDEYRVTAGFKVSHLRPHLQRAGRCA